MRIEESATELILLRWGALKAVDDGGLRAEVSKFAALLCCEPVTRPIVLEVMRGESAATGRFLEHQDGVYLEVAKLLGELLWLHRHDTVGQRYRCTDPRCEAHLEELDASLIRAVRVGVECLVNAHGRFEDTTPVGRALECLRVCATAHVATPATLRAKRLKEQIERLSQRHDRACRDLAERVLRSPAHCLRALQSWATTSGSGATEMGATQVRYRVRRLCEGLLSLASQTRKTHEIVEGFRARCESESAAGVPMGPRGDLLGAAATLTALAIQYLQEHGLTVWTQDEPGLPCVDPWGAARPVAVQAIAHGAEPRPTIVEGVRRFHAVLETAPPGLCGEAYVLLLRVGGPRCSVPPRIDLDHVAVSMVRVDVGGDTTEAPVILNSEELLTSVQTVGPCVSLPRIGSASLALARRPA